MSENLIWDEIIGGAIRITSAEYFIDRFIHLHGDDITMFGDGVTVVFHIEQPIHLREQNEP
jgi:hypothetical protein